MYVSREGTSLGYTMHTTPGTSGSAIENVCRQLVYAIHTNGGCQPEFGFRNFGTVVDQQALQDALANPQGVCADPEDCNANEIDDACDINCGAPGGPCDVPGCGASEDCTGNGIPDECEPDCNRNGVADSCDIDQGTSMDNNANGVPDQCDPSMFVDVDAPDGGDGLSWDTSFNDLQDALTNAVGSCGGTFVKNIWVAVGTYTPDRGTGDRSASFEPPGIPVGVYGGFAGGETKFEQRDPAVNVTILSGDLNGDDGPGFANNDENSSHVVYNLGGLLRVLDGFTISGGNADGTGVDGVGGGIYNVSTAVTIPGIANCIIRGNFASNVGGGMFTSGDPGLVNALFTGNSAGTSGGAVYNSAGNPDLRNCTFSGNSAGSTGGGISVAGGIPTLTNCILWGNTPDQISGTPTVTYSDVQGGFVGEGNINVDPLFVDPEGPDGVPGTEDDNLRPSEGSPCIDAGDNAAVPPDIGMDLDYNPRVLGGPQTGFDCAVVDMGSYEYTTGCGQDSECADPDPLECTDDVCREDGLCENVCVEHQFADIVPVFCQPSCPQPDTDDILCLLDDFGDGPAVNGCGYNWYSTDLVDPCGGDGFINMDDVLAMLDAFGQNFLCEHCICDPCGEGAAPGGGAPEGDRSAEAGEVLLVFLTTRAPVEGPYEHRFAQAVNVLTDWVAGQTSFLQRVMLAEQLQDPSLEFASPVGEAMVPQIVTTLLEEYQRRG